VKNFIKKHWVLTGIVLVTMTAMAAKIGDDLLKIGKPGSTADKSIVFDVGDGATNPSIIVDNTDKDFDFNKAVNIAGELLKVGGGTNIDKDIIFDIGSGVNNPRFRWNSTSNVLEFSTDGTSFKKIGSGAGGASGVNVLSDNNFDFEIGTPPSDWTASGGTFTAETAAPLFGAQSGSWDASALSQTLDSVLAPITTGFLGNKCQAEISYIYAAGTFGDYKMVVRQFDDSGASEVSVSEVELEVTTTKKKAQLFFDCPDDVADDLRVRIEAAVADPGVVIIDDAFIGTGRNDFQISQTELVAHAEYQNIPGCVWSRTSASFGDFPTDADCPSITVHSSTYPVDTADNDLPDIDFDYLPPGKYVVQAMFSGLGNTTSVDFGFRISDGTTTNGECGSGTGPSTNIYPFPWIVCTFTKTYTDGGPRNFKMQGYAGGGSAQITNTASGRRLNWKIVRYPTTSNAAITLETSGWYVNANIGGSNPGISTGAVSTYSAIVDGGLDMVVNPGSEPAKIPCNGGNQPSVGTCSAGSEVVGISVDVPTPGRYKFCSSFGHEAGISVSSVSRTAFTLEEWQTDISSKIQDGTERVQNMLSWNFATNNLGMAWATKVCSDFTFSSPGEKLVLLLYEHAAGGTVTGNFLLGDRSAANGQRDINWTVEKLDEQKPTPVFTDLESSLDSKVLGQKGLGEKVCYGQILNTGTPALGVHSSDCVQSVTDNGVGDVTVNFSASYYNNAANCVATADSFSFSRSALVSSMTASSFKVTTFFTNSITATDVAFRFFCIGE